jgi:hypothetical protein
VLFENGVPNFQFKESVKKEILGIERIRSITKLLCACVKMIQDGISGDGGAMLEMIKKIFSVT